jgi:hypothetical protein
MKIAVKYHGLEIDAEGTVAGSEAGHTLVRRLLKVFPDDPYVVGPTKQRYPTFTQSPLSELEDPDRVIINMDVIDSVHVWRALHIAGIATPKIMNFLWSDTSQFSAREEQAELALSAALFPTFANSERTAASIQRTIRRLTVADLAESARISWVNLGIRLEHVQPRTEPEIPVVLYPAIYLSARKQPQRFIDIVSRIAKDTPIRVEVRLTGRDLASKMAIQLSQKRWTWVGPLTPTRQEYWERLSRTTAFLATASEETYGLEYIEALVAGAVGVFPDTRWARAILPEGYPFLYPAEPAAEAEAQAEAMLRQAIADPAACRAQIDAAVGGSFQGWLRDHHSDDTFEASIEEHVHRWFA